MTADFASIFICVRESRRASFRISCRAMIPPAEEVGESGAAGALDVVVDEPGADAETAELEVEFKVAESLLSSLRDGRRFTSFCGGSWLPSLPASFGDVGGVGCRMVLPDEPPALPGGVGCRIVLPGEASTLRPKTGN